MVNAPREVWRGPIRNAKFFMLDVNDVDCASIAKQWSSGGLPQFWHMTDNAYWESRR